MKVLIAGAGPSGLTAGIELARRGVPVGIIERSDGTSTLSRAVGINPRSLELLTPSGVTRKLLDQGVIYNHVLIYRGATLWATAPLTAAPIRHGYNIMLGLPQDQTEAILRDRFAELGGTITYGVELSGVRQDERGIIAETTDGGG
jgi:2-polyprenyl-6-methoxyphenol hydroxylase-like FAD-dependent oxidoreductase